MAIATAARKIKLVQTDLKQKANSEAAVRKEFVKLSSLTNLL